LFGVILSKKELPIHPQRTYRRKWAYAHNRQFADWPYRSSQQRQIRRSLLREGRYLFLRSRYDWYSYRRGNTCYDGGN